MKYLEVSTSRKTRENRVVKYLIICFKLKKIYFRRDIIRSRVEGNQATLAWSFEHVNKNQEKLC